MKKGFEIETVEAVEMLDSRGNPTLGVDVYLKNGARGCAMVPSGTEMGQEEAAELRDQEKRYGGKGVEKAVINVNTRIADRLSGMDALNQQEIDRTMIEADGTEKKARYGANAIMGVSVAVAKAAAMGLGIPFYRYMGGVGAVRLPLPMVTVLNGDMNGMDHTLDFQEFMIVPCGADSMKEAVRMSTETYHALKHLLLEKGLPVSVGEKGGFSPGFADAKEALAFLVRAMEKAGYRPGDDLRIAIDAAAHRLYDETKDRYYFPCESKMAGKEIYRNAEEMVQFYEELAGYYPVCSIEDGLYNDDVKGWKVLTYRMGSKIQLVGDALFSSNRKRIQQGKEDGIANAVLIKMNQIGTLTETMETVEFAKSAGYQVVLSHRSGETEDTVLADLSVAFRTDQIKTGAPCRSERTAKYNRLLKIESELKRTARFR